MISVFNDFLQLISNQRLLIREFDAMHPSEVLAAVHRSVTASIVGSAFTKNTSYKIDPVVPDWKSPFLVVMEGIKTPPVHHKSLRDIQRGQIPEPRNIMFKCAPNPFAEGTECLVYNGYDITSRRAIVLKKYKFQRKSTAVFTVTRGKLMYVLRVYTTYAALFNKKKPQALASLEIIPVDVVLCVGKNYYLMERFLERWRNTTTLEWCATSPLCHHCYRPSATSPG